MNNYRYVILLLMIGFRASAQVCSSALSLFFEHNQHTLNLGAENRVTVFVDSLGSQKEYVVEIIGYTDSLGNADYNQELSRRRAEALANALRNSSIKIKSLRVVPRGELQPRYDNGLETERAKNRRVDLILFPIIQGRILLKGQRGGEIEVEADYFEPCGICETNPRIVEIFSGEEAEQAGIPLVTKDGMELITGGMIKIEYSCPTQINEDCRSAIVRLPAASPDTSMTLWESVSTPEGVRWVERGGRCKPEKEGYEMYVPCLKNAQSSVGISNCDVRKCKNVIFTPALKRDPSYYAKDINDFKIIREETRFVTLQKCLDSSTVVCDIGFDAKGNVSYFRGAIAPYKTCSEPNNCYRIPDSAYQKICRVKVSLPKLTREPLLINMDGNTTRKQLASDASLVIDFCYDTVQLYDAGRDTFGIQYTFKGNLEDFSYTTSEPSEGKMISISLTDYQRTFSFDDTIHVIKTKKKFREISLYIIPADTLLKLAPRNRRGTKLQFRKPLHPCSLKYGDSVIFLDEVKMRYKRRKGYYKVSLRK